MAIQARYGTILAQGTPDPNTVLLLPFTGADASTTITDIALGGNAPHTLTANGDAQIDTAQYQFPPSSLLLDGTGDYVSSANNTDWDFGTGEWTVEFWARRNGAQAAFAGTVCAATNAPTGWAITVPSGTNQLQLVSDASGAWQQDVVTTTTLSDGTSHHIAFVRSGNTVSVYVDGTSEDTVDATGWTYDSAGTGLVIGRHYTNDDNYYWTGHLDEVRISKGVARYTGNFTPSGPFTPYL